MGKEAGESGGRKFVSAKSMQPPFSDCSHYRGTTTARFRAETHSNEERSGKKSKKVEGRQRCRSLPNLQHQPWGGEYKKDHNNRVMPGE